MSATSTTPAPEALEGENRLDDELAGAIEHAAHLLPQQGPITVFIHHNTLHALENLTFEDAVGRGAEVFGCQPYLGEDRYRDELIRGRIRFDELREVLAEDLGVSADDPVPGFGTRLDLRLAMLQDPLRIGPTEELVWYVAEYDALRRARPEVSSATRARLIAETRRWAMRDLRPNGHGDPIARLIGANGPPAARIEDWSDAEWEQFALGALWRICGEGVRDLPPPRASTPMPVRHRDVLFEATGRDADAMVHPPLIRLVAAFLDQGLAAWTLPGRDQGFFSAFTSLYSRPGGPPDPWRRDLADELRPLLREEVEPLESIRRSLDDLGVSRDERDEFLSATLLALRGWAGMIQQVEERSDRVVHPIVPGSLVEFLAVRLLMDRCALAQLARETIGYEGPLSGLREAIRRRSPGSRGPSVEQRAFLVFQLAQVSGASPDVLYRLDPAGWAQLVDEIEGFGSLDRRRVFHLAYERRFQTRALDAIAIHAKAPAPTPESPRFQLICCLDDREESFRRHVEELAPDAETFGTAGFFSVAMYYRGADDAHAVPLCPAVIRPRHWVVERPIDEDAGEARRRHRGRWLLGMASHQIHTGSRSLAQGALLAPMGVLASIPLVARTLVPRLTAQLRQLLGRIVLDPPRTRLQLERTAPEPGPEDGGIGFTVEEMAEIAERILRELGLTDRFARLVLIVGHGSTSLNNPHESAYDCGACGGSRGGPNARALAQILNDLRVRGRLSERGLSIPITTRFVGGMHNTSSEALTLFDVDRLPADHREDLVGIRAILDRARERNAHERCRRFLSAPLTLSFAGALQHVEARAEDLGQARPECGHATNAIVLVGRRDRTRGLFLDRRAFLASYDPTRDDPVGTILERILMAVFPVCAGINLEYYFSSVDNTGWGAGTKLPHNITAMLGVMDGYQSDLRTGLPWQMVELHEPVRGLFVIETRPMVLLRILGRNASLRRLCDNGWVALVTLDPETRELSTYRRGTFEPYRPRSSVLPRASSSTDWYRGWRDHLEFATIRDE